MAAVSCSRRLNMVKWPQQVPVSTYVAPGTRSASALMSSGGKNRSPEALDEAVAAGVAGRGGEAVAELGGADEEVPLRVQRAAGADVGRHERGRAGVHVRQEDRVVLGLVQPEMYHGAA
jgi:hypothetical protein